MADPEGFLSRWSRLKGAHRSEPSIGEAEDDPRQNSTENQEGKEAGASADNVRADASRESPAATPTLDLTTLPPIDSITAATDIRAFLAPGVPVELTRAALRRAWVVDPKIRNFIGMAENQWDFTAPETIPGFGPLKAIDDVRKLVADVFGEKLQDENNDPGSVREGASVQLGEDVHEIELATTGDPAPDEPVTRTEFDARSADVEKDGGGHAATHQDGADHERVTVTPRRRHGGALPE
jgi:hypothetical protein